MDADDSKEEGELSDDEDVVVIEACLEGTATITCPGPGALTASARTGTNTLSLSKSSLTCSQNHDHNSAKSSQKRNSKRRVPVDSKNSTNPQPQAHTRRPSSSSQSKHNTHRPVHSGKVSSRPTEKNKQKPPPSMALPPSARKELEKAKYRSRPTSSRTPKSPQGRGRTRSLAASLRLKAQSRHSGCSSKKFDISSSSAKAMVDSDPVAVRVEQSAPSGKQLPPLNFQRKHSVLSKNLRRQTPLKKVAETMQDQIRAKSPSADVNDPDYIDLLLEYKQIQDQLASIKEEEKAQQVQTIPGEGDEAEGLGGAAPCGLDSFDPEEDWHVVDEVGSDLEGVAPGSGEANAEKPATSLGQVDENANNSDLDDDDELQLLQLRAVALASAAHANKKFIERESNSSRLSESSTGSSNRQSFGRSRRASSSSRKRTPSGRSPREKLMIKQRCSEPTHPYRSNDRPARNSPRQQSRRHSRSEKEADQLRLQRILAMDDHAEQTKRFLELLGVDVQDVLSRGSRTEAADGYETNALTDNYDEVEMEVSSIDSIPEVEMEDAPGAVNGPPPDLLPYIPQFAFPQDIVSSFFQQQFMNPSNLGLAGSFSGSTNQLGYNLGFPFTVPEPPPPLPDCDPPASPDVLPPEPDQSEDEDEEEVSREVGEISSAPSESEEEVEEEEEEKGEQREEEIEKTEEEPEQDEELEEEEDLLRAQLLQSVARKRQAKLDAEVRSAGSSSPVSVHSTFTPEYKPQQHKLKPQYRHKVSVPQHAPVVISLGEDSSDEEAELKKSSGGSSFLGSLDMFLKEARQTVEAQEKKGSTSSIQTLHPKQHQPAEALKEVLPPGQLDNKKANQKAVARGSPKETPLPAKPAAIKTELSAVDKKLPDLVRSLETELIQRRKSVAIEQKKLELVKYETTKEKAKLRDVEQKMQKLQEQLAVAERIKNFRRKAIVTLNAKAQIIQSSLDEQKSRHLEAEKKLLLTGRKCYGNKYRPRLVATDLPGQPISITIANTMMHRKAQKASQETTSKAAAGKENQKKLLQNKAHQQKAAKELAQEKLRLQQIEKLLATKIKQYKESQQKSRTPKPKRPPTPPVPESIKTEEKMVFGFGAEVEKEMATITPRRRRSLLGQSPTMKPQLEQSSLPQQQLSWAKEDMDAGSDEAPGGSKLESGAAAGVAPPVKAQTDTQVEMPTGANLERIRKLVRHNLSNPENLQATVAANDSASQLSFAQSPVPLQLPSRIFTEATEKQEFRQVLPFSKDHRSLLLHFRSFRFSPYFRTKEKLSLTSSTFSHKIDPNKVVCRFDLMGKCNDEHCQWQHYDDMKLSKEETLQDLASYSLSLAGIPPKAAPSQCGRFFKTYVDTFTQQNRKIKFDDQCLLLVGKVNDHCSHTAPHTTFLEPRKWKPVQAEKALPPPPPVPTGGSTTEEDAVLKPKPGGTTTSQDGPVKPRPYNDTVLTDQDIRYWMLTNQDLVDMESAVLDNPQDVPMWIKLAYKKLHDGNKTSTQCLDEALGVLARSLESNQNSSDLWLHYLMLFSRRGDTSDLLALSQQALLFAPSYELFWKNLELSQTFPQKNEVCSRMRAYLCSPCCMEETELRSHHLIEILLHQVLLHVSTGRYKKAINVLQGPLKRKNNKETGLCRLLTTEDKVVAWLSYLSLVELGQIPAQLYDPADSRCGRIVCKDKIHLSWRKKSKISLDKLHALFRDAIKTCVPGSEVTEADLPALVMLYKNLVRMDLTIEGEKLGWMGAFSWTQCQKFLKSHPYAIDLYVFLAEQEHNCSRHDSTKKLFEECLEANLCSAQLYHSYASYHILLNDSDMALQLLERCAIQHFEVDVSDSQSCDPNLLYCKLLDQPVPLSFKAPNLWSTVTQSVIDDQLQYLWINYSLLLELQGELEQSTEAFETALCKLRSTQDIQLVWQRYLQQAHQRVSSATTEAERISLFQTFRTLLHRCLTTTPCKMALPRTPGSYWLDYSFHNTVLDFYLACLPADELDAAYSALINLMPSNVKLVKKVCERSLRADDVNLVRGLCMTTLADHKHPLDLWKMYIAATYREGSLKEVGKLYKKATKHLPLLMSLWKNYALFELAHGTEAEVRHIYQRCLKLDVNIFDYLHANLQST